ncbi:hypothetical protein [Aneurinibacillus terranovensis]|uniref:hypothetical protein n=1 Tax=Aneurinibacillus terranovensis TaxID=278991 RepID=UPI00048766AC
MLNLIVVKPKEGNEEIHIIQGFDIEIDEKHAKRIDRLVDDYEKRILHHLHLLLRRFRRLFSRIV